MMGQIEGKPLLPRLLWEQKVAGSIPAFPIIENINKRRLSRKLINYTYTCTKTIRGLD
jgi:hypothetical protein